MTVDELMIPKVIVQFSHPHSPLINGEILTKCGDVYLDELGAHGITADNVKRYTDLFRPLQWWEFRELEDMPEYVKMNDEIDDEDYHSIYMVTKWFPSDIDLCNVDAEYFDTIEKSYITLPASKQDYDNYIKSQND